MKQRLFIILLILAFALLIFLGAPLFLKPQLRNVASKFLKKYFRGDIEIAHVDVSVWKDFPQLDIEWEDLLVKGTEPGQSDTILWIGSVQTKTSIRTVLFPSDIEIDSLVIDRVRLNLNSKSFTKRKIQEEVQKQTAALISTGSKKSLRLNLHQLKLNNAELKYTVQDTGAVIILSGINAGYSGGKLVEESDVNLIIQAEELNVKKDTQTILTTASLAFKTHLATESSNRTIYLTNGEFGFDKIPILINGSISAPGDSVFFDLELQGKETGFAEFLALFPAVNKTVLKNFKSQGSAEIEGSVNGFYYGNEYPEINFSAFVSGASLQYPGMPGTIDKLQAEFALAKPQGTLDSTRISIRKAHAEFGKNQLDLSLEMLHPFSDPVFDGILIGKINLADLQSIYPFENVLLNGEVDANLLIQGTFTDVMSKNYSSLKSDGVVWLHNVRYSSPKLASPILVREAKMNFSDNKVGVQQMELRIGQSDFTLKGEVDSYLNFLLNKGILVANLQLNSRFIDLNQLFLLNNPDAGLSASLFSDPAPDERSLTSFKVPSHVNLKFNSTIEHALLSNISMEDVRGTVIISNEKLILQDLNLNMLNGKVRMSGSYENTEQMQPKFDFGFNVSNFDIPTMAQTLDGFRKMVPGSENSTGRINAELQLRGQFDNKLKLISESASGTGHFSTKNLVIVNSPLFKQLGGIIQKEKLLRVDVDDFTAQIMVEKGNVQMSPFETKVIGQPTKVSGTLSAENMLEMQLDFMVDRKVIGTDIQKILAVIPGNEKIKQLPASVRIDGPSGNPRVHPDLSVTTKAVADATKDELKNTLDKLGKSIFKLFK